MILNYYNFLLETRMTSEKEGSHLELNKNGKNLEPFKFYYKPEFNENYYILKNISFEDYKPLNNKVTLLFNTTYKDNDEDSKKKLINTDFNENDYYFYQLYFTKKRYRIPGININFMKNINKFNITKTEDDRLHFIVIQKNNNVTNVKLNSGISARSISGDKAEKILSNKFGFTIKQTKINKKINIIPENKKKSILYNILTTNINDYDNLFDFVDNDEHLNKYDLIINDGILTGSKIEVKKYDIQSLFYKNGQPKKIEMSEQLKISNKSQLKQLVDLYKKTNPNENIEPLINNYINDHGLQLSNLFSLRYNGEHINLINNIREFYNTRIDYLFNKYKDIPNEYIMNDIYGIYFFNTESGVDGFLIESKNDNNDNNFKYFWNKSIANWGLKRIKLLFEIDPKSYRMVWLGDQDKRFFIKTFQIGDFLQSKILKKEYVKSNYQPIIKNTEVGPIKWDYRKGYWVSVDEQHVDSGIILKNQT